MATSAGRTANPVGGGADVAVRLLLLTAHRQRQRCQTNLMRTTNTFESLSAFNNQREITQRNSHPSPVTVHRGTETSAGETSRDLRGACGAQGRRPAARTR